MQYVTLSAGVGRSSPPSLKSQEVPTGGHRARPPPSGPTNPKAKQIEPLSASHPLRSNRLDVKHRLQQVLDNLVLARLPRLFNLADLLFGLLVGLLLGLLVSLRVLMICCRRVSTLLHSGESKRSKGDGTRGGARTSDWNFLNSCSFPALYSSISFLASSRASLTLFVRTTPCVVSYGRWLDNGASVEVSYTLGLRRNVSVTCSSTVRLSPLEYTQRTFLDNLGSFPLGLYSSKQSAPCNR